MGDGFTMSGSVGLFARQYASRPLYGQRDLDGIACRRAMGDRHHGHERLSRRVFRDEDDGAGPVLQALFLVLLTCSYSERHRYE